MAGPVPSTSFFNDLGGFTGFVGHPDVIHDNARPGSRAFVNVSMDFAHCSLLQVAR